MFGGTCMKPGLAVGVAVFFVVVSVILVAILYGPSLLASGPNAVDSRTPIISNGVIVSENAHLGTKSWQIPTGKEASTQIQAYASATSVLPGQKLTFYVSTQSEGTVYSVNIYRLGWYQGYGGRTMSSKEYKNGRGPGDQHT